MINQKVYGFVKIR